MSFTLLLDDLDTVGGQGVQKGKTTPVCENQGPPEGKTQGIGDVSEDHEIQLGNGHHGRVAHYCD